MIAPIFDGREVGTAAAADVDVSNAQFLQSGNGFLSMPKPTSLTMTGMLS